ncbi:MAG TPA: DHH family phosphoesterase [Candidatus Saccharimonadia bacterium]|nr:DHH family phosphoesterase [Candidatus Saccharimonadia bacterium]
MKSQLSHLAAAVADATTILILQPDSPDGDSLGTALGLEEILGDLGKTVAMYAYKAPESYLHGLEGWDRVSQDLPKSFDLTILVDTGAPALIKSALEHHFAALTSKPFFIIDHHVSRQPFGFTVTEIVEEAVATSELVTRICLELDWPINEAAAGKLASALLSDSLGLTTSGTTARSVEALAELTRRGANLYELYKTKREAGAITSDLLHLKGKLLESVEFYEDGKLAVAEITPDMVAKYKDIAEPYTLILNEMQWTKGVELVAVFKNYGSKINVPLRSTTGVAAPIAEIFGGGGHPNAAAYRTKGTHIRTEIDLLVKTFHDYLTKQPAA